MKIKKILEYLLYVFVFLLPWQTRWIFKDAFINREVWEYGRMSIYSFDVIFIVLCIIYLVWYIKEKGLMVKWLNGWRGNRKNIFLFFCFFVLLLLNIFIADDKMLAIYWWLRILQGIVLVWLLSKINFDKIKLILSFVISLAISAGFGVWQFLNQNVTASKWLGIAGQTARDLGVSVIEFADERWLRAYGSFSHPNVLGGFCLIGLILLFWLIKKNKFKNELSVISYQLLGILLISGLFFSFSRASWIGFILLFCYLVSLLIKNKIDFINLKFLITCCLLLVVCCWLFWPLVKTRILGNERLEIKSNTARVENNLQGIDVLKNNLWLGVGVGNYTVELQKINSELEAWNYSPVHNVYLLMLAELGLVEILLICCIFVFLMKNEKIKIKNEFVFLFFCFFVFMFLFDHFWWTSTSGMLSVFLLVGVFLNKNNFYAK